MLDASQLRNILHYNPETGEFRWLVRPAQRIQVGDNAGCLCKTHGYVDIRWDKTRGLWKAQLGSKNGMRFIGRFPTKDQAHAAYCEAAQREFGEFARVA